MYKYTYENICIYLQIKINCALLTINNNCLQTNFELNVHPFFPSLEKS